MGEKNVYWFEKNTIYGDAIAAALCYTLCRLLLKCVQKSYDKGLLDVYLMGKLCHIIMGLVVMLFWPIFSSNGSGTVICGLILGFIMRKPIINGFGRPKVNQHVKLLKKYADTRILFKAAVGYLLGNVFAANIQLTRTNLAIAVVCNLCVGDGVADIIGRRLGSLKLPYNQKKSYAGSIGMAIASFLASIIFRYYLCWWGYIEEMSPNMVLGFLTVSIASALVESHPLSTTIEDNLTVPIASILIGNFVL